ncbi:MAG: COG4223 family protein [Brevirhabdus sp.]
MTRTRDDQKKAGKTKPDAEEAEIVDATADEVVDAVELKEPAADPDPESTQDSADEPESVIASPPVKESGARRSPRGALALVGGGVIAALVGFLFAFVIAPEGWPIDTQTAAIADLEERVAEQKAEQGKLLREQVALTMRLSRAEGTLATLGSKLDPVSEELASLTAGLADAHERIAALESRPVIETTPDVGAEIAEALAGYRDEVEALKTVVSNQEKRANDLSDKFDTLTSQLGDRMAGAEALAEEAKRVERAVLAQGALAALGRAIQSGAPYGTELATLVDAADISAPAGLSDAADTGMPTLNALQTEFPAAARAALSASISVDPGAGALDRLGAFLKAQTGARSLSPKEGDDPDAVLSRAEQALREGRVADALNTLSTLPDEGLAAMADWAERARLHAETMAAYDALTVALSPN